jgi:probable FeS assembly SUF system protein SufT
MSPNESVTLARDVDASVGSYTVVVNGNMFRIEGKDADALGREVVEKKTGSAAGPVTQEFVEKEIWNQLRTCYDPEIPVNVVDLGLIYDCHIEPMAANSYRVGVKMTLTAPGCGMGPVLQQDVQNKLLSLESVDDVAVELVWDPPWNQSMLSEAAKLQLGLM